MEVELKKTLNVQNKMRMLSSEYTLTLTRGNRDWPGSLISWSQGYNFSRPTSRLLQNIKGSTQNYLETFMFGKVKLRAETKVSINSP